jgi:hypothetical protein
MTASDSGHPSHATARSPFAGCAILIAALLVMVFLIGFSTYTLFRQFNEIAKFTAEKPELVEVVSLDGREAELNDLAERLEGFRQKLGGDAEATLALSAEDLNLAIAAYDAFKELRGTFRVIGIEDDRIRIAISFPLNGKPRLTRKDESGWITSDPRFLNATMIARPALLKRELVLRVDALEVPNAKVPREFIEQMSPYRITERYLSDPVIGPAMAAMTEATLADGRLLLRRTPGASPADAIGRDEVDSARNRFFTILAISSCVFLIFAGVVVFLGLRSKQRDA